MPPQFFKDAHSVLNNKFVPRSFALNLNANGNADGDNSNDSQSFESPNESSVTPRATSTAASTGSSSRFFSGYTGGKDKVEHNEDILEDSSMENFENMIQPQSQLKKDHVTEGAPSLSAGRPSTSGSDILEITEVREVKQPEQFSEPVKYQDTTHKDDEKAETFEYQAAETSADLIMEALVKSQRLCSQYKQKLSKAETKLMSQEDEILGSKKAVESLKLSVKKAKDLLSTLESKSNTFYESHKEEKSHSLSIKQEIKNLLEKLEQQKSENSSLKKKFDYLKQIRLSSGYEVEKKNREIEHFQERLDENSGLLSEQKIKCSELEKKLESCRKDYDEKLSANLEEHEKTQKELKDSLSNFKTDFQKDISTNLSRILPLFDEQSSAVDLKIEQLVKRIDSSLKITGDVMTSRLINNEQASTDMSNNLTALSEFLKRKIEKVNSDQAFVNSVCTQVLDECKQLVNDVKKNHSQTSDIENSCKNLISGIEMIDEKIKESSINARKLSELMELNKSNEKEISEYILKINGFNVENERLSKEIESLKEHSLRVEKERDEALKKLQKNEEEHEKYLSQTEQKAAKCKTTSESKLRTQMEIHKLIGEERDKLKEQLEMKNKDLSNLRSELLQIKAALLAKEEIIGTYQNDKSTNDQSCKELEIEITRLKDENKQLCDKIDAQLKSRPQNVVVSIPESQESTNDLELTASFQELNRKLPLKPVPINLNSNTSKTKSIDPKKKTIVSKYTKRKKLLDDDDDDPNYLFDDFEFMNIEGDQSIAPKRNIKRKKVTQRGPQK